MNGSDLVYLARSRARLSQKELGEKVGLAQNAIARIEKGDVRTSFETVRDLVRACGFEPEVSLAPYDSSYRRDIKKRLALSPAERISRATELARTAQRMRQSSLTLNSESR